MSVELATPVASGRATAARARARAASPGVSGALALRLVAFFAFSWVAAAAYATLLAHPPQGRTLALAAAAAGAGAGLALSARLRVPAMVRGLLSALLVILALALGFALLGVPVRLLEPTRWGELSREISRGVDALGGDWLWPYRGSSGWTRISVLTPLVPALTLASALCFWPSERRAPERRLLALGVLIALLVTGLANASPGAWRVQGVLLTVLLFAWFWLPTLAASDAPRAGGWLLACVLAALLAAPLLAGGEGWFGTHAPGLPQSVSFRWDQLFGPIESPRSTETMLTVSAPAPGLLRVTSLDRFDGQGFVRTASPPATRARDLHPGPRAPGSTHEARITVSHLRSSLLAGGEGVIEQVRWPATYDTNSSTAADGTLGLARPLPSGATYVVDSYVPQPTPRELRDAPRGFPQEYRPYTRFDLPTAQAGAAGLLVQGKAGPLGGAARRALAASPYAPVYALARRLARGAHSAYEVARKTQGFLRSSFAYTETPPRRRYPLVAFLFEDRRGYCQQFAGAMTLMLRMDGIPARVGVGFKPSLPAGPTGTRVVRATDAHAWVETYFSGIGWVSFDPTPAGPATPLGLPGALSRSTVLGGQGVARAHARKHRVPTGSGAGQGGGAGSLLLAGAGVVLVAMALAFGGWLLAGSRRIEHALQDGATPAIDELRRALARAGWPAAQAATLNRIVSALRREGRADAAAYVELLLRARFAPRSRADAVPGSHVELAEGRAALRRALGRRGGLARRAGLLFDLPPAIAGGRLR